MTKKKRINSRNKGAEYERKIAKVLGLWWDEDFNRTPMSGGLQWKEDNRVTGDIVTPPDSVFPFVIECKKREEWTFEQLLKGTGEIESWWEQVTRDCDKVSLRPFLIFSKNFAPDYGMLLLSDFVQIFPIYNKIPFNCFTVTKKNCSNIRIAFNLDDFIKHAPKELIVSSMNLA